RSTFARAILVVNEERMMRQRDGHTVGRGCRCQQLSASISSVAHQQLSARRQYLSAKSKGFQRNSFHRRAAPRSFEDDGARQG
ncbi:MAG TPA: hypothetical protein VGC89_15365, partial [Pyrinomonadaceae bacterium]